MFGIQASHSVLGQFWVRDAKRYMMSFPTLEEAMKQAEEIRRSHPTWEVTPKAFAA